MIIPLILVFCIFFSSSIQLNIVKTNHGPIFVRQPVNTIFDTSKSGPYSEITLSCFAIGQPTPTYKWYKEDYENDRIIEKEIDPLTNDKYTISGGSLIIREPKQRIDQGIYHCKASNRYGTIISESASLNFGYVFEFNYNRSAEYGSQNWGKVIACDNPNYYPKVRFNWARDFFPNFVEEDKRVFVSFDGSLYFSSLESVDRGNYSCSVRSDVSDVGKNGPFFPLHVYSHSNYQQLYFPNNFPKVFPDAPIAGQDIRLECIAFGYPVPSYNWSRSDNNRLPSSAEIFNYGRVLIIPKAKIEDQGTYICNAFNDRGSIQNNVTIKIQSEPKFLTPLDDKYVDKRSDVLWSCLAFGIPDVNYTWYKNGKLISQDPSDLDYNERYIIDNNMLSIKYVDPDVDAGMYQCRAQNQLKEKYSAAQLFTYAMAPTFENSVLKTEILAPENGFIEIPCNPDATPVVRFQWRKYDLVISSSTLGGRGFVSSKNGSLIIYSTRRDDEGIYKCIATNNYGSGEMYVTLIIREGPRIRNGLPPYVTLEYHSMLEFNCAAELKNNDLDLAYYWYHNNISLETNDRMIIIDGFFTIENMTFLDSGVYKCDIVSAVGNVSSESVVTVLGPPGPPGGLTVGKIGITSVTLYWTNGAENGYPILYYIVEGRIKSNNTWHVIAEFGIDKVVNIEKNLKKIDLDNVLSPWCTYEFMISAVNELGKGLASLPSPQHTTSPSKPTNFPDNISGGGGKIGDLTVTWDPLPPHKQHGPGIYYIVYWKRQKENQFRKLKLDDFGNTGIAIIQIEPEFYYTKYDVKVQAANMYGIGPESDIFTIYSAEDMPQVAPQLVFASPYNSTALNVSWQPVSESRETLRGKLIGYRIKYWKKDGNEEDAIYYLSRNITPSSLIVGLQPNIYYMVKVLAYNSAGEGPESERFTQRTYRKAPQKPPSSVIIKGIDPSTIEVSWRYVAPAIDEEPVIGFKIRIWKSDESISKAFDTVLKVGRKLKAIVYDLTPGISYNLRVLAYSNGGEGRMSSPTSTFKTV